MRQSLGGGLMQGRSLLVGVLGEEDEMRSGGCDGGGGGTIIRQKTRLAPPRHSTPAISSSLPSSDRPTSTGAGASTGGMMHYVALMSEASARTAVHTPQLHATGPARVTVPSSLSMLAGKPRSFPRMTPSLQASQVRNALRFGGAGAGAGAGGGGAVALKAPRPASRVAAMRGDI